MITYYKETKNKYRLFKNNSFEELKACIEYARFINSTFREDVELRHFINNLELVKTSTRPSRYPGWLIDSEGKRIIDEFNNLIKAGE